MSILPTHYKWLVVVEGIGDVRTFCHLLKEFKVANPYEYLLFDAGGKSKVMHSDKWDKIQSSCNESFTLLDTVRNDLGREGFEGLILIVDSDESSQSPFSGYSRNKNNLQYVGSAHLPILNEIGSYWLVDTLKGCKKIPIYGINVPVRKDGCFETDILEAYKFPVNGQSEYEEIKKLIRETSKRWKIRKDWWKKNEKAKMDKFISIAFHCAFKAAKQKPKLSKEPGVITTIKSIISTK
jgi:hypothetical protein